MEKAYAKLHGNYEDIISGHAHVALRELTGAPAICIYFDEKDPS